MNKLKYIFLLLLTLILSAGTGFAQSQLPDSLKKLIRESDDLEKAANWYLTLSQHFRKTDLDSSTFYIERAIETARNSGDEGLVYRMKMSEAVILWMQGNLEKAADNFEKALAYWRKAGNQEQITRCLLNLGTVSHSLERHDKAVQHLREAFSSARKNGESLMQAQAAGGISNTFFKMQQMDSVEKYMGIALDLFETMRDSANMTRAQTNWAFYYRESGQASRAKPHIRKAISYLPGVDEKGLKGEVYEGLGILEYRAGNYEEAIGGLIQARKYYRELGWIPKIANNNNTIGNAMRLLGRKHAAREQYESAFHLADSVGAVKQAADALTNLADMAREDGKYREAVKQFHQALRLTLKNEMDQENFGRYMGLGIAYHKLGQRDSADFYSDLALQLARQYNNEFNLGTGFYDLAEIAFEEANYSQSLALLDSSEKWMSINRVPRGLRDAYLLRSKTLEKMGRYPEALEAERLATVWRDSIFSAGTAESLLELEAQYWSEKKQHSLEMAEKNQELKAKEAELAREESERLASQKKLLLILIVLIVLFGSALFYLNLKRKQNEMQHKISKLRMQALRAQMNPHFIFNALGSVQLLINTQKAMEANQYLTKFARLLRMILERSSQSALTLEEEVEGLQLYVDLEALRFKFSYEIEISPELNPSDIEIPGMMIQPFVENAIKHGLSGKNQAGRLKIRFVPEGNEMKCIIEDNGVGRAQTAHKSPRENGHVSMGTQIIREQLELLRPQSKERLKIIDLQDPQGNPTGTRVEILFPL